MKETPIEPASGRRPNHSRPGRVSNHSTPPRRGAPPPSQTAAAAAAAEATNDEDGPSLPDQVLSTAVAGTLEVLKFAGALTLNATGKVVAPPLYVTRTVVLPQLWAATVDILQQQTPQRLQDWFRILQSAVAQFVEVLLRTHQGEIFRQRLVVVLGDVVDCLSSDLTRQLLIDTTSLVVKVAEALHTPESKLVLEQWAVWSCRGLQVLSSGRLQRLVHDASRLLWEAATLCADPQTVAALAEVTAYLCYALEMEDAVLDGSGASQQQQQQQENNKTETAANQHRRYQQQRRNERDEYQKRTHNDRIKLQDPDATVEEVIVSSLGDKQTRETIDNGAKPSLNSTQNPSPLLLPTPEDEVITTGDDGVERENLNTTAAPKGTWNEQARREINVVYLQEKLKERACEGSSLLDLNYEPDMEDGRPEPKLPDDPVDVKRRVKDLQWELETADDTDDVHDYFAQDGPPTDSPSPRSGESSSDYFYRVLDEVLQKKREEGTFELFGKSSQTPNVLKEGAVRRNPSRNGGNKESEATSDSVRNRLESIRQELTAKLDKEERALWKQMKHLPQPTRRLLLFGTLLVFLFIFVWFCLGCYGMYVLVFHNLLSETSHQVAMASAANMFSGILGNPRTSPIVPASNEIVIRVVREVVHLDRQGDFIGTNTDSTPVSDETLERITQCIAGSQEKRDRRWSKG